MFSIITPNFRSGDWLKLCIASVADQGVALEHIIQDPGSDDGTLDWLLRDKRVKGCVEKDQGMYDAVNRGLRRSQGDLLAWLNADEQYLPGALQKVQAWFGGHPEVDLLVGDVVMIDREGKYLWHRKMQTPLKYHTWTCHLSTLSCGMFFRRRVVFDYGFFLDPNLRDVADGEWMLRLIKAGVKMATLGDFTSAFTQTGSNMSAKPNARREALDLRNTAPVWARALRPLWITHHRVRRLVGGTYHQPPFAYDVFTLKQPEAREHFEVSNPKCATPRRPSP